MSDVMMGCDDCLGRREFLQRSALFAAVTAALAACVPTDATSPSLSGSVDVNVNDYAALANVGGIALVNANGSPIAVVRTGASSYAALSRICPHQGSTVNVSGGGFLCPGHGARFTSTGQWTGGQPTSNLHAYATSYDAASGILTVSS
jgi:cytochrome b6-f complex iron-sulfur subunit